MTVRQQMLLSLDMDIVQPGSSTFDSGSGNFTVPMYHTLTIEVWGGGGSPTGQSGGITVSGVAGGTTTCSGMTATGGATTNSTTTPGAGGTASGGNTTNTNGNVGGNGGIGTTGPSTGAGAPNGGGDVTTPSGGSQNGVAGTVPGGGGSGVHFVTNNGPGGSSGAYAKSVYTRGVTPGYPAVGALVAYAVGAGGPGQGTTFRSGDGRNGRVKFTWS